MILIVGSGWFSESFQFALYTCNIKYEVLSRKDIEYDKPGILLEYLRKNKQIELVINAAGFTGKPVDVCESRKTETIIGNVILPEIVSDACLKTNIPLMAISSGCLYSGTNEFLGYSETDEPNFTLKNGGSFYAQTKIWAEQILSKNDKCWVLRPRIPFTNRNTNRNYITKLLTYPKLLNSFNSLTCLEDFITAAIQIWKKKIPFGVYNLTNPSYIDTEYVINLIKKHKISDKEFEFFSSEEEFNKTVITKRSNTILNTSKLSNMGIHIRPVEEALEWSLKNWNL